jgi:hypothetical protein
MPRRVRIFAALTLAAVLCGCGQSTQSAIDDAYRRGQISSADKQRLTEESNAKRVAAREASMQEFGQQPQSNPNYKKLVVPQRAEDPHHTGRPIDEAM